MPKKEEIWGKCMGETPRRISLENLTPRDYIRMATELVMPYTTDNQFLHIVYALKKMSAPPVQSLTLSAGRPSILNGFRDFTGYAGEIAKNREEIEGILSVLYGEKCKGIYEIAMAEWYYQTNDSFHALLLVTGTIPLMENQRDIQCLFVAMALQMKILLLNGQMQAAAPLVQKIRERVHDGNVRLSGEDPLLPVQRKIHGGLCAGAKAFEYSEGR